MYFILDERWIVFIKMEQVLGLRIAQHVQRKDKDAYKKLRCIHAANDLSEKFCRIIRRWEGKITKFTKN